MTTTREFELGDVLSVTTSHLVSTNGIGAVYEVIDFMLGPDFGVMTHEIPRVMPRVQELIFEQHPKLFTVKFPKNRIKTETQIWEWLGMMAQDHGSTITLEQLSEKDHDTEGSETEWAPKSNADAYKLG